MVCIYCGNETRVINSRHQKRENHIWRRRQCLSCNTVFTTEESPDLASTIRGAHPLHKAKGTSFSRDKLFLSLYRALGHRSDAVEASGALSATIIVSLRRKHAGAVVTTTQIRDIAHNTLKHFDAAAAVAYAAYHAD